MIPEEIARRERLQNLREQNINPYPIGSGRDRTIKKLLTHFEELESSQEPVAIAGRVRAIRKHGGVSFIVLQDESERVQLVLHRDTIGVEKYTHFHDHIDVGDILETHGPVMLTKKGERSQKITSYILLSKALLPLPEKWHGLSDVETRFRKRELDLIANPAAKHIFMQRSLLMKAMRDFYHEEGFLEIETPILQPQAGGAEAKPFVTHHNALGTDLFLRIAPELYLKRCVVGGFEKVFEIARCFRNEGISFQHNPEFTQVECYWAYANKEQMMEHIERLLESIVKALFDGETTITHQEDELSFASPLPRLQYYDLVQKETGINLSEIDSEEALRSKIEEQGLETKGIVGFGELADHLWKKRVRPSITQPTFVLGYPAAAKPLAKRSTEHPERSSNVQLLVKGMEVMNGFDELNDPIEQEERFKEQEALRERGSEDAHQIDYEYLDALKTGLPPSAGYGMGIDRLCTLLLDVHNIKEVILFPTLKPKQPNNDESTESEEGKE